jgi:hypothetical protein
VPAEPRAVGALGTVAGVSTAEKSAAVAASSAVPCERVAAESCKIEIFVVVESTLQPPL